MKLRPSDFASIAEILGAVAIAVSLLFVGFQITDSNRKTRAATVHAALGSEMAYQSQIARYADTWNNVYTGKPLSEGEEMQRGIALYNMMTLKENRYLQMKSGFLEYQPDAITAGVTWPICEAWQKLGG